MGAEGNGEAAELGEMVGDDGGGDLVHGQASVLLWYVDGHQAEITGFFQQGAGNVEMLGLNRFGFGKHLVANKVRGGARDLALLFGEVFRGHDLVRRAFLDEEASAANDSLQYLCRCCQLFAPWSLVDRFENARGAHASTNTHGHQSVP